MTPDPDPDLFLIVHKVRGERAFDIAIQVQIGAEEGWIIPSSGHRAWPTAWMRLDFLTPTDVEMMQKAAIDHLRDHYEVAKHSPEPNYTNRATGSGPAAPRLEDI